MASYAYDAAGRRTAFNGGFTTSYGYDPAGRLQTLANNLPASTWNNQWSFGYNPAGQIINWTRSNDMFAFAAIFNVNRPYTANGLNQYTAAGAVSFAYDANGNLTGDGVNSFTYDVENRLVAASGGRTANLRYDPLGRLYEVSGTSGTTRFLYDGDALAMEYGADGTLLRRYIHGADMKADDPIAWYEGSGYASTNERILRPDWQGSIVAVADSGGTNMVAVNRYDEYGIPQPTNSGRFQYTGQAFVPELGMYYYKARFYSPTLGRFLQTDPIGYKDQVNLYAYVGNDPVDHTDPTGLKCQTVDGKASCTFDAYEDKKGRSITREQAMATKAEASRIAKLEAGLTSKYIAAQALAARNESVTIRGDSTKGVLDQSVSGKKIVKNMESATLVSSARLNPSTPTSLATTLTSVYYPGFEKSSVSVALAGIRTTFWNNKNDSPDQTFGHEMLHPAYTMMTLPFSMGWDSLAQSEHQESFNDAANQIR